MTSIRRSWGNDRFRHHLDREFRWRCYPDREKNGTTNAKFTESTHLIRSFRIIVSFFLHLPLKCFYWFRSLRPIFVRSVNRTTCYSSWFRCNSSARHSLFSLYRLPLFPSLLGNHRLFFFLLLGKIVDLWVGTKRVLRIARKSSNCRAIKSFRRSCSQNDSGNTRNVYSIPFTVEK